MEKKQIVNLAESILTTNQIFCDDCRAIDTIVVDNVFDSAECFYNDGWRCFINKIYCPDCAKQKLKK